MNSKETESPGNENRVLIRWKIVTVYEELHWGIHIYFRWRAKRDSIFTDEEVLTEHQREFNNNMKERCGHSTPYSCKTTLGSKRGKDRYWTRYIISMHHSGHEHQGGQRKTQTSVAIPKTNNQL